MCIVIVRLCDTDFVPQRLGMDFGDDEAFCAFDLGSDSISRLLSAPRPPNLHTRWISLWLPYNQKDTLHVLAKHYDFSPRLLGLMCSDPLPPKHDVLQTKKSSTTLGSGKSHKSLRSRKSQKSKEESLDSEESIGMTDMMHSTQLEMFRDLSHYHIVDEVWHWSTVDWGRRCKSADHSHTLRLTYCKLSAWVTTRSMMSNLGNLPITTM